MTRGNSRGTCPSGEMPSRGEMVGGGKCPEGKCQGGKCPGGKLPRTVDTLSRYGAPETLRKINLNCCGITRT